MRRRVIALLFAVIGAVALFAGPAAADGVKDGPGCGFEVGYPGKPPIVRIDC